MSLDGMDVATSCVVLGCLCGKNMMLSVLLLVMVLEGLAGVGVVRVRLEAWEAAGDLTVGAGKDQGVGEALAYVRRGGLKM